MRSILSVFVLLFAAVASAASTTGNRLLVLLDDVADKDAYSKFLGDLLSRGFDITYETPKSEGLSLFHLGERTYDHLLFLPTKVKGELTQSASNSLREDGVDNGNAGLGPNLTPSALVNFVKADGNVLVTLSSTHTASTSIASFLAELDIALPAERTGLVVDHFNYDTVSASEKHEVLVLDAPSPVRSGVRSFFSLEDDAVLALPNTVGHTLGSGPLLTPILRAPATAYSYDPKEQGEVVDPNDLFAAGSQLALASVFQGRNSARVAVLGSAQLLQDKWIEAKVARPDGKKVQAQNREFAKRLSGLAFQELGVLRVNSIEHRLVGDNETNPGIYRIKNEVSYSISLSEYSWDAWKPFTLTEDDALQLEFSMLSPFHRLALSEISTTEDTAIYGTTFVLPDQHGIFNFRVNYKRPFLTNLDEKITVSVRHIAHDEWPRSFAISGAWPWISGIGATIVGFLGFVAVWLYSKPPPANKAGKKL